MDVWSPLEEGKNYTKDQLINTNEFNFYMMLFFRKGQAIWIDENIRYGKTDGSLTFNNPPLASTTDFEIRVLEVYGFQNV